MVMYMPCMAEDPGHNVDDQQEHILEDLLNVLVNNNDNRSSWRL